MCERMAVALGRKLFSSPLLPLHRLLLIYYLYICLNPKAICLFFRITVLYVSNILGKIDFFSLSLKLALLSFKEISRLGEQVLIQTSLPFTTLWMFISPLQLQAFVADTFIPASVRREVGEETVSCEGGLDERAVGGGLGGR